MTSQTFDKDAIPDQIPEEFAGIEILLSAVSVVERYAPKKLAIAVSAAVNNWIENGGSLDHNFGIKPRKQGSPRVPVLYYTWRRDQQLYLAHGYSEGDGPTAKSRRLSEEIALFRDIWPGLAGQTDPDDSWSRLRKSLFLAFKYGEKCSGVIPSSTGQLLAIVRRHRDVAALDNSGDNQTMSTSKLLRMRW